MEYLKRARLPRDLGHAITIARDRKKWTQEQLAEYSGVSQASISRIEQGLPGIKIETYLGLCHTLDLELLVSERSAMSREDSVRVFSNDDT